MMKDEKENIFESNSINALAVKGLYECEEFDYEFF